MISKPVLECVYRSLSIEEAAMWSAFEVPLMWRGFAAAVACDPRRRHSKARFRGCPATGSPTTCSSWRSNFSNDKEKTHSLSLH